MIWIFPIFFLILRINLGYPVENSRENKSNGHQRRRVVPERKKKMKKKGGKKNEKKKKERRVRSPTRIFLPCFTRHNLFVQPEDLLRSATDARVIFFKRVNLASRVSTRIFSNEKRDLDSYRVIYITVN